MEAQKRNSRGGRILIKYIHTSHVAFGHKKKQIVKVYDNPHKAYEEQMLCGGKVEEFVPIEQIAKREEIKKVILSEVAQLIDDMSTEAPGSPRSLEPSSAAWDLYKIGVLNTIEGLINEIN